MVPLIVGASIGAAGLIASIIGAAIAEGKYDEARRIREQFASEYGDENLPQLDELVSKQLGPTELSLIREDETLRGSQVDALRKLEDVYRTEGMTEADQAAMRLADIGAQQRASSDYQSMQQALAARGQSMNPALASAMAQQSSGKVLEQTSQNRLQAQVAARQRALQALEGSAQLAGGIRSADWTKKSQVASAADAINRWNAQSTMDTAAKNLERLQLNFQNRMALKSGRERVRLGMANDLQAQGDRIAQIGGGMAGGLIQGGAGLIGESEYFRKGGK